MPYVVELRLDPEAERRFLDHWDTLERAGITDLFPRLNYRPHVTLGMYRDLDVEPAVAALARYSLTIASLDCAFRSLVVFTGESYALCALAAEDARLRALHRLYHESVAGACLPHYLPDSWVPHCTLGMELDGSGLVEALAVILPDWQPITGRFDRLTLLRIRPGEVLWDAQLPAG